MGYFSTHNHTHYSNIRLIDSINKPTVLIDKAIELGLTGIVITDHEALCAHMEVNDYAETLRKTHPDFTIGLGNEIYLTNDRSLGQKYYHFILIAKNAHGYRLLKELSSIAWQHSYMDKGLERVPLLKSELKDLIKEYKGDIIGTTACIGSEIGQCILGMEQARKIKNTSQATQYYNQIKEYISFCIDIFGKDDFYIECAPANNEDQILVNKKLQQIAKVYDLKMIFATDSHYLSKDQRVIHKAYLNSKEGDREVDSFYEFSYLMGEEEARELLLHSFDNNFIDNMIKNTLEIQSKITWYSLKHHPQITEVEVKDYPKQDKHKEYPTLHSLYQSDNKQERYWINQCEEGLIAKGLQNNKVYWDRLEEEADIKRTIGEKLQTNMFSYPITLQHYINLFWDCGSTVGVGRGCFVPTTLITMKDGSTKKISDVKIGDYVLSAKGNIKKVIDVLTYDCKEELYQITPSTDTSKTITCTNNHEFWVMSSVPCLKDRYVCSKNCSREDCKKKELLKKGWKKAEDLTEYDYIFYPRPKLEPQKIYKIDLVDYISDLTYYNITDTGFKRINGQGNWCKRYINIDNNFMYTLGVIIGDGWTCLTKDKSCLGIAFNSSTDKDKNSMIKISNYFKELGFNSSIRKHKDKSLNQLYVYSKPLTEMFRCMVGNKTKNKKIPSELMFDNKELMLSLLEGLLASDGSYEKDHLRFSYDSINYSLISQVKELCAYLGIYASITTRPAHGKNQESYKLRASGPQLSPFIERLPLLYNKPSKNKTQTGFIVEEDGFYFRIKNISTVSYSGKVHDLTVEDDHCYLANNVGVHNSACSGLNHYLLGVTQLDPIKNNFPFWRLGLKKIVSLYSNI